MHIRIRYIVLCLVTLLSCTHGANAQSRKVNSWSNDLTGVRWTTIAHRMPTEWYASAEAKKVAENLLISQKVYGGWEKNQPYHLHFSDSIKQYYLQSKNEIGGTFDNGSTITEMRFLAKVYANTRDPRYKEAFEKGLNYIFMAQYQNGGWPQFYPARKTEDEIRADNTIPYSMHITYNDNAMLNTMNLLKDIFMNSNDFASLNLDEETKKKAKSAFDTGIECILNTQIPLDGQPTVWCAQHHYQTLKPVAARSYELESFSGAESAGLVLLLMEVDNPSYEIIAAVEGAINWFRKNKIEGIRVERFTGEKGEIDARVIEDENAPPLWGRFYDLETVTPFFCSRDGIKRGSMEEIDRERRAGYGWYTDAPSTALKRYPIWREKTHDRTTNS